jgi:hypothetical protein
MTYLEQLRKSNDDGKKRLLLPLAITEKIEQLKYDLKTYPGFFFKLPGVASIKDKNDKIKALDNLRIRILFLHQDDVSDYSENILDGITLELYKVAAKIYPNKFADDEIQNVNDRNPRYRLLR